MLQIVLTLLSSISAIVLLYDTLGHIAVHFKNYTTEDAKRDYERLTYTWIFYLSISTLCCLSCCFFGEGTIGLLFRLVYTLAKVGVCLPIVGGTKILTKMIIEDELLSKSAKNIVCMIKSKINPQATAASEEKETK